MLPDDVVDAAEAAYRTALADRGASQLLDQHDQVLADGAAIVLLARMSRLRRISSEEQTPQESLRRRGQLLQQISTFSRIARRAEGLVAFSGWLDSLSGAMRARWPEAARSPAPLFPAYRGGRGVLSPDPR